VVTNATIARHAGNKSVGQSARNRVTPPARRLLSRGAMRVLEARFYPERRTNPHFYVVGHLLWHDRRGDGDPVFQPSDASSRPITFKLNYLMNWAKPDSFHRLQSLRSEFWSFVEIPEAKALRGH
jgi:hypothetical protein